MSVQDAERFANDLKAKPQLLAELKRTAAGKGLAGICQFAKQKGYTVTVDEAKQYIRGKAKGELNDQQLDRIAGGKGGGTGGGGGGPNVAVAVVAGPQVTGPVTVSMMDPVAVMVGGPSLAVIVIT
jgi:predicted ribosomally synthesized peptide with nif11-like leader